MVRLAVPLATDLADMSIVLRPGVGQLLLAVLAMSMITKMLLRLEALVTYLALKFKGLFLLRDLPLELVPQSLVMPAQVEI